MYICMYKTPSPRPVREVRIGEFGALDPSRVLF